VSSKSEFRPHPVARRRRLAGTLMVLALAATALVMWPVGPLPGRSWGFIALGLWVGAWIWLAVTSCRECGKPFFWKRAGFNPLRDHCGSCGASVHGVGAPG
jgi:hypothetical protein